MPRVVCACIWRELAVRLSVLSILLLSISRIAPAQDGEPHMRPAPLKATQRAAASCRTSNVPVLEANDTTFVSDCPSEGDLDTGCVTKAEAPNGRLTIRINITRVFGDISRLRAASLIEPYARLTLPAYDVDSPKTTGCGCSNSPNPELDRVSFNGKPVKLTDGQFSQSEFLTGECNKWKKNEFLIPLDWIRFPTDPGPGNAAVPAENIVTIDIDTANSQPCWCTNIDWVALQIMTPVRPVVMVHGILSSGRTWEKGGLQYLCAGDPSETPIDPNDPRISFVAALNALGIPNSNNLNMGCLHSIGENATLIALEVANARRRWGVEKVNLLCHSKGGLDSREYVEYNDDVERVIQLGTPNDGSPLADQIQLGLLRFTGGLGSLLVNGLVAALSGPAGIQLTTPYMKSYNYLHALNPNVKYTAIAGDYVSTCSVFNLFGCTAEQWGYAALLQLTGPGDTIVPITSVHAVPGMTYRGYQTIGEDLQATHMGMTSSTQAFAQALQAMFEGGPAAAGNLTTEAAAAEAMTQNMPQLIRAGNEAGAIRQGQIMRHSLFFHESKPSLVTLLYPSGNLDLALISPSGQRFDAQSVQGNPQIKRDEGDQFGGRLESYAFLAPEPGHWTMEVTAPQVTSANGSAGYLIGAWVAGSEIAFTGANADLHTLAGQPLRLTAQLKKAGLPLTASVTAKIASPDNTVRELTLHDNGSNGDAVPNDGTYSGIFTQTSQPGLYRVLYMASRGNLNGEPGFYREAVAIATASRSDSRFTGAYRDLRADTDRDGFYNKLIVEATVTATQPARYRVLGLLTDAQGNQHEARAKLDLRAGTNVIPLAFDGAAIFRNRVDGPYTLSSVRLAEEDQLALMPTDARTGVVYRTPAYRFGEFQRPLIFLTGNGTSTGIDANNNGRFDQLRVGLELDTTAGGAYTWSGRLTDRSGKEIGFASNAGALRSGVNTLTLDFNGETIGRNGVDGPYFVRGVLVLGPTVSLTSDQETFPTQAFRAGQFEGGPQNNPTPSLRAVTPTSAVAGGGQFTLTVQGANFVSGASLLWNGSARTTVLDSATQLRATIPAVDIVNAGTVQLTVVNPAPGGGPSNAVNFVVTPAPNPVPAISALMPSSVTAGGAAFTLTVTGNNFLRESVVRWNGTNRTTTFVSATQLIAAIPATDIATAGSATISIYTPPSSGGGGGTASLSLPIIGANPGAPEPESEPNDTASQANPLSFLRGRAGAARENDPHSQRIFFTDGSSEPLVDFFTFEIPSPARPEIELAFARSADLDLFLYKLEGQNLQLHAYAAGVSVPERITTPQPLPAGRYYVAIGVWDGASTYTLTAKLADAPVNPVPVLSGLTPRQANAGSGNLSVTIIGSNFVNGARVRWNGAERQTTFINGGQLTAVFTAEDLRRPGTFPITIVNPAPGGGFSNAIGFPVILNDNGPEVEPNNTPEEATRITFPGKRSGSASRNDPFTYELSFADGAREPLVDFFAVDLPRSTRLALTLAFNAAADLDLFLYQYDGHSWRLWGYAAGEAVPEKILLSEPLPPGRYYIAVGAWRGASTYTLTVESLEETGANSLAISPAPAPLSSGTGETADAPLDGEHRTQSHSPTSIDRRPVALTSIRLGLPPRRYDVEWIDAVRPVNR